MELKAFTVRDSKAEIYAPPFFQKTHAEAERTFTQVARDGKSQVSLFPQDYDLYFVGTYDDSNGKFSPIDTPQHIIKAVDCQTPG